MHPMIPFKLDSVFRALNTLVSCADCGKRMEFRQARIAMTDISEGQKSRAEMSINELARNIVWTILCPECWRRQHFIEPKTDIIQ